MSQVPLPAPASIGPGSLRYSAALAVCILLATTLLACTGGAQDSATDQGILELEAKVHSLEESLQALVDGNALVDENALLKAEIAVLRQEQADFLEAQQAAEAAKEREQALVDENALLKAKTAVLRQEQADFVEAQQAAEAAKEREQAVADFDEGQEEQLAALEEAQVRTAQRLDDLDARLQDLEEVTSTVELLLPAMEQWSTGEDKQSSSPPDTPLERTAKLAEDFGGEVYYVKHPGREDRSSVLVMPLEIIDGQTPLIVSLHGYGADSTYQSTYVPLHERVNTDGFALLLPNGAFDGAGNRSWDPTHQYSDSGKASQDDVAYLTELVARAKEVKDFGPVYFFGYSNGGFMSYHIACKGLPGLRAVASLAGTSYVDDSTCDGAPPVSVLHIHGTADNVILFEGYEAGPDPKGDGERPFYAGAHDMVTRWSQRAGCHWPEHPQPYATLDLDQHVPGPETQAFRLESGCAEGISIELWTGTGSTHSPSYTDAFLNALLHWLLSQH